MRLRPAGAGLVKFVHSAAGSDPGRGYGTAHQAMLGAASGMPQLGLTTKNTQLRWGGDKKKP